MWNKEKQSLLEARTNSLKQAEERIEELATLKNYYKQTAKEQREIINKQEDLIKRITLLAEGNTYSNDKILINKIKELAKTGIRD